MTDHTINSPSVGNPIALLAARLAARVKEKDARRKLAILSNLAPHRLRDIGLRSSDVTAARSLPLSADATDELYRRAHLNRSAM